MPRGMEVFLSGLEPAALALPPLGSASVPHSGVRRNAARTRWLHTACMIDCYRDDSVMQHVGVALSEGLRAAARGDIRQAWSHWADRRNAVSLRAAIRTARVWTRVS